MKESMRGRAVQTDGGLDVRTMSLAGPQHAHFEIKNVFPQGHADELLKNAMAGKKIYQARLFDGSFSDRYTIVNAMIGNRTSDKTWSVSMAFYDPDSMDLEPEYEMNFTLYEDGVIREMNVVYPDFTLSQTIRDLKLLEQPSCD